PILSGSVDEGAGTVDLVVDAAHMQVLDPNLSPEKRAQVQERMLGPDVLDVTRFPRIEFHAKGAARRETGEWHVKGDLTLRGQTHPVEVRVSRSAPQHYRGSAALKQTAFGITPITIAGGTVKVKDEVKIEFDVVTQ